LESFSQSALQEGLFPTLSLLPLPEEGCLAASAAIPPVTDYVEIKMEDDFVI
jgi:hypothetical protein